MSKDKTVEMAITRLKVGAPDDLTGAEINALIEYIRDLEDAADQYGAVMDSMSVDFDDMFPNWPERE